MPESASMPTQPRVTASATRSSHPEPAATVTVAPEQVGSPESSTSVVIPVVATSTTRPSKPSSATTRLDPPPSTSTGVPTASASDTAATSSSSVVARTHSRPGPPRRRVVWSRSSGTNDGLGHPEDLRAGAGDLERQRGQAIGDRLHRAGDDDLRPALGRYDDRAGELRTEVHHLRTVGPLGDRASDEGEGVHPVRDDTGQADARRDSLVLMDRVVVAARLGVGHEVGAGDREGPRLEDVAGGEGGAPAEWTRVALPVQTTAPVASVIWLAVAMMSAPPIWRSPVTVSVAVSSSPT